LRARDEDIPIEHLVMTKKYVEQERERANLFNDVAFSSGEFRNVEALVRGQHQNQDFLESRGITAVRSPATCASPSRNRQQQQQQQLNPPQINVSHSPSHSRSNKLSLSHQGRSSKYMEDDMLDPMDAFKRCSCVCVCVCVWTKYNLYVCSVLHMNI
jgi:hypothetical protein